MNSNKRNSYDLRDNLILELARLGALRTDAQRRLLDLNYDIQHEEYMVVLRERNLYHDMIGRFVDRIGSK